MPLLYALRDDLGLNNPHFGCGLAQCGACTVHIDGQAMRSCVTPVSAVGDGQGRDARRPRHAGEAASDAERLCRRAGAAMRLLHQRLDHDGGRRCSTRTRSRPMPRSRTRSTGLKCRCGTHMSILRAVKRAADDDGLRESDHDQDQEKASAVLPPCNAQGRRRAGRFDRHADRARHRASTSARRSRKARPSRR